MGYPFRSRLEHDPGGDVVVIQMRDIDDTKWAACDTFRGVIDPAQYKDYILVMLFLKYISDQWADHYAAYRKEYGDNEERIRRRLARERFIAAPQPGDRICDPTSSGCRATCSPPPRSRSPS